MLVCTQQVEEQPNKKLKKGGDKSAVTTVKSVRQLGCVLQDTEPPESSAILPKGTQKSRDQVDEYDSQKGTQRHADIRENKGPSHGKVRVKIPRQRSPHAVKFEIMSHEEIERQERCARGDAWRLAKNILKLKETDKATFFSATNEWCLRTPSLVNPEEREFVADSSASMHMLSRKDLNSAELDAVKVSKSPTTAATANGEVQTKEEATVYVKELDLFVAVMLLEDTLVVLSRGQLCENHGYSYHWTSGQKPQRIEDSRPIKCNTANHVPIVVPGLSAGSSRSATPTAPTSSAVIPAQRPAWTRSESTSGIERVRETRRVNQKKTQTQKYNRDDERVRWDLLRGLPEWSGEFTENLVDESVPAHRTHQRVLLVKYLQSREEKWYRARTVFVLTSRRTSAWEPKIQGLLAEEQQITKFLVKDVNLDTIINTLWWYNTWQLNEFNLIGAKPRLLRKRRRPCKSSRSRRRSQSLTIPKNLANPVKTYPGIMARQHLTVGNKWDCWQSGAQNEGRDFCGTVPIWSGWKWCQVPWNVSVTCTTDKISCLMGRHLVRSDSENHLKDQLFHLVQWSNITLFLLKTCRDCISSVRKSYQVYSSVMYKKRWESGKETFFGRRHWGIGGDGRIWNPCSRPWMVKKIIFPVADVKLSGRDQVLRTSNSIWDRGEEQGRLLGEFGGSSSTPFQDSSPYDVKQKMISGPFQGTLFTVIKWNPESNCTCRLKNHSLSHWNTLSLSGLLTQIRRDDGKIYWRLLEPWGRKRIVGCMDRFCKIRCIEWETTGWIYMVRRETDEERNEVKTRQCVARYVEAYVWCIETQRNFCGSLQSCSQSHSDASSYENTCNSSSRERMEKLEKIPAGQLTRVRNINEVMDFARNKGRKVHFASLMDHCHLKNSELEPQYQKYKGRVVLRGDIMKEDSGSYAVFTEQVSSASQMAAA